MTEICCSEEAIVQPISFSVPSFAAVGRLLVPLLLEKHGIELVLRRKLQAASISSHLFRSTLVLHRKTSDHFGSLEVFES